MRTLSFLFILFIFTTDTQAQEIAVDPVDLEIDGLIIDETRTRIGRDFYEKFYTLWTAPFGVGDYSIFVEEQPPRGRSAAISVKVNEKLVSFHQLQPREEVLEEAAKLAVARITKHLQNYTQMQSDLENGDQSGTGIY
jgi:curli production assembly/transport component CsgE